MVIVARRVNPSGGGSSSSSRDRRAAADYDDELNNSHKPRARFLYGSDRYPSRVVPVFLLVAALVVASIALYRYTSLSLPQDATRSAPLNSLGVDSSSSRSEQSLEDESSKDPLVLRERARAQYQNCTVHFVPPPRRTQPSEWRTPFWVTSFPASGSASPSKRGDMTKSLIDAITGLPQATKNYHMSVKGGKLRRCKGMTETAACTQGHPYVPVGPELQTDNFQPHVIFSIRNFATAFPAGHTDKNMAYHKASGQPPEEQWRRVRDQYMRGSLQTWREMIEWWNHHAAYYRIALYLPWEWLLSPTKGPALVQELAHLLSRQAGFEVAPPEDIPCIWFQTAEKEWKRQEQLMQYSPGYTQEQRDWIVKELDALLVQEETQLAVSNNNNSSNNNNDKGNSEQVLVELLLEYKADLLASTSIIPLDRPALKNRTQDTGGRR